MNTFAVILLCAQACLVQNVFGQCLRGADIIAPACGYGTNLAGAYALDSLNTPYGLGLTNFAGGYGYADGFGYGLGAPFGLGLVSPLAYGGEGIGDVTVIGELPVAGTTLIAGQVPIMGAVGFGGIVPAGGEVSIAGSSTCGCRGPYLY